MNNCIRALQVIFCVACFPIMSFSQQTLKTFSADIIVYGGNASAVMAAVQAKQMGKSVIMVSPDVHLGGLTTGGLGLTDTGDKTVIGGLALSFDHRLYLHYAQDSAWVWQKKSEYGNKGQGTTTGDSGSSSGTTSKEKEKN